MDFSGTRRQARSSFSYFFEEKSQEIIEHLQPSRGARSSPKSELVSSWRMGGYQLASFLLPTSAKRFPEELNAFIQGMQQRLSEYESENSELAAEQFDVAACEKLEGQAHNLLKLATHETTPVNEARAAALGLAKMIARSEMALLGWERVRHFAYRLSQMEALFAMIRRENPTLFLWGEREITHGVK